MNRIALSLAAVLALSAGSAFAAGPAMEADSGSGKILVNDKGMTLYTFDKDEAGKTNCYDQCAKNWPPLMAAEDAKPEGDWTLIDRTDGGKMWAYKGKPVYLWVNDAKAGDMTGEGKGNNTWHVAKP